MRVRPSPGAAARITAALCLVPLLVASLAGLGTGRCCQAKVSHAAERAAAHRCCPNKKPPPAGPRLARCGCEQSRTFKIALRPAGSCDHAAFAAGPCAVSSARPLPAGGLAAPPPGGADVDRAPRRLFLLHAVWLI